MKPKVLEAQPMASGKFLRLEMLSYNDASGRTRKWETVQRMNQLDAVAMIATVRQTGEILLVKQFRPPLNAYAIEFPAGLVDPGETAEMTAVRELKEETGYIGEVRAVYPFSSSSAGLTGEKIAVACLDVDLDRPENQHPETDFQGGEDIQIFRLLPADLPAFFAGELAGGAVLDAKVTAWTLGMGIAWQ